MTTTSSYEYFYIEGEPDNTDYRNIYGGQWENDAFRWRFRSDVEKLLIGDADDEDSLPVASPVKKSPQPRSKHRSVKRKVHRARSFEMAASSSSGEETN
jgi:hypothetical protein